MKLFGGFHGQRSGTGKKPRPWETEEKNRYEPEKSARKEDRPAPVKDVFTEEKAVSRPEPPETKAPPEEASLSKPEPPKASEDPRQPEAEKASAKEAAPVRSPEGPPPEEPVPEQPVPEAPVPEPVSEAPAPEESSPEESAAEEPTQEWTVEEPTQEWKTDDSAADTSSTAKPPEAALEESGVKGAEGTKEIRFRTPEEEAEIEEIIAAYQKKKKRRRIIVLAVLAALVIGGVVLWKSLVKPPEIIQPTARPTAEPTTAPTATPVPGNTDPTPTPTPPEETPPPERMRRENVYTFLMIGRDQGGGNTDTIMAGVFDVEAGTVDVVSIPRDTCANVDSDPKKGETKKISGVYARADYDGLREAVADMLGYPIDCYVSVGINGFIQLVNNIGGVYFDVPHYMNYDDPTQDLHIHFSPGVQYLNGYDAIKIVRWRQNNDGTNYGDIDRINTQQAFLKTVFKQCLSLPNLVSNLDDYIEIFQEYVKTDLTTGNMTWFAKEFLKLDMENIHFHTMPSNYNDMIGGFSYGTILVDEWLEMLNEHMNVYDQPITLEDLDLIYRDENGSLCATSGEIRGGMDSFLTMEEYMRQLREWNAYLDSLNKKDEESSGTGESAAPAEAPADGGDTNNGGEE